MIVDLSQEEINALIPACLLAEGNQPYTMLPALYQDLIEMNAKTILPGVRSKLADVNMKTIGEILKI